jgi:hypothetical protein
VITVQVSGNLFSATRGSQVTEVTVSLICLRQHFGVLTRKCLRLEVYKLQLELSLERYDEGQCYECFRVARDTGRGWQVCKVCSQWQGHISFKQ